MSFMPRSLLTEVTNMKLRLRSLESKETVKIEVPNPCTLRQLKETLSQSLSLPLSSSSSSLHFSLNRKDELHLSSPEESLQSLGITSGDLIYFSNNNNNEFSSSASPVQGTLQETMSNQSLNFQKSGPLCPNTQQKQRETHVEDLSVEGQVVFQEPNSKGSDFCLESKAPDQELSVQEQSGVDNTPIGETLETQELDMDSVESMDNDAAKRFTEPYFLRRVLREELGGGGSDHKLLVIAVHSVFLESGFVGFDSVSRIRVDRFNLPEEWPSVASTASLWYTLPELLGNESVNESVVLKFQRLGHFVNVYGCLTTGGSGVYRVCLNESRFVPTMNLVWANCDQNENLEEDNGSSRWCPETEVFDFWKIVKDRLALPLLIDLCDKTGLVLPSCLMRLPAELKLKILELLPGVDIAKVAVVCSEMRYLSSNSDLWKQKFVEEFGNGTGVQGVMKWKLRYASYWKSEKKRKRVVSMRRPRIFRPHPFPIIRDPYPFGVPAPVIGGDYDHLPGLGIRSPFGRPGQPFPQFQLRRNFSPNCDLGGFNA